MNKSKPPTNQSSSSGASIITPRKKRGQSKTGLSETATAPSDETEAKHLIAEAINKAIHKFRDIEAVASLLVPTTGLLQKQMMEKTADYIREEIPSSIKGGVDSWRAKKADDAMVCFQRLREANLPNTLVESLFLGLFSAFDAFIGDVIIALHKKNPSLVERKDAHLTLSELSKFSTLQEAREHLILQEIEDIRRCSYSEQFQKIGGRIGVELKKFNNWGKFIEISQRRNLITHCDGVVSKQYLKVCGENGAQVPSDAIEGSRLKVNLEYLKDACGIVYEVALKMGQTLWRRCFPNEHNAANEHLSDQIYEALQIERWDRALMFSDFAASLKDQFDDLYQRMRIINNAIALKFSGKVEECNELLGATDWSASLPEFELARAVLSGDFDRAAILMLQIGQKGSLIEKRAYLVWPLFREFRPTKQFAATFKKVYGTTYQTELAEEASIMETSEPNSGPSAKKPKASKKSEEDFVEMTLDQIRIVMC